MESNNNLKKYLGDITRYLKKNLPNCILMPSIQNGKMPIGKHKSVESSVLWAQWEATTNLKDGLVIIMRDGLIVIDIDDMDYAKEFEKMFPIIRTTSIQQTKKGFIISSREPNFVTKKTFLTRQDPFKMKIMSFFH